MNNALWLLHTYLISTQTDCFGTPREVPLCLSMMRIGWIRICRETSTFCLFYCIWRSWGGISMISRIPFPWYFYMNKLRSRITYMEYKRSCVFIRNIWPLCIMHYLYNSYIKIWVINYDRKKWPVCFRYVCMFN